MLIRKSCTREMKQASHYVHTPICTSLCRVSFSCSSFLTWALSSLISAFPSAFNWLSFFSCWESFLFSRAISWVHLSGLVCSHGCTQVIVTTKSHKTNMFFPCQPKLIRWWINDSTSRYTNHINNRTAHASAVLILMMVLQSNRQHYIHDSGIAVIVLQLCIMLPGISIVQILKLYAITAVQTCKDSAMQWFILFVT